MPKLRKSDFVKKLNNACKALGTYEKAFDITIQKAADIMFEYEEARALVEEMGRFVDHTNKSGATNLEISPAAQIMRQCRVDLLAYLNALGLTPTALKKIQKDGPPKKQEGLLDVLKELGA